MGCTHSKPAQALRYALENGEIILSLDLLEELNEVLERERFNRYVTSEEREEFLDVLVERAALVEIIETVEECRDRKDDKLLELALIWTSAVHPHWRQRFACTASISWHCGDYSR